MAVPDATLLESVALPAWWTSWPPPMGPLGTSDFVGLFEGTVLKSGLPDPAFNEAEIASLPNGTSLVVGNNSFAPTITTVTVNDDGV